MKYINGNLIELANNGEFDIIVHGCNCFNIMGAGIALQIKNNFPSAYLVDQQTIKGLKKKLGSYSVGSYSVGKPFMRSCKILRVINAYTQYQPGPNVDYSAIQQVFEKLATVYHDKKFGIPKIGAGIAGGNWYEIESIIDTAMQSIDLTCVIL